MLQVGVDGILDGGILVEFMLVDDGISLGYLFFIRTGPALEVGLLVPLFNGVEKVVAFTTELHSNLLF